jgi:predicted ribosome quality control (RQC) complex YloA/Tae2 family protein
LKAGLTSFDIAALVWELKQKIKDARIGKIYQVNSTTLLFKLHRPAEALPHLLIESGKRIHLTSYVVQKPPRPPAFCMALRKSLESGRIIDLNQQEFERTVIFQIHNRGQEFHLIIELFGEGNIILVGSENKILHALVYKKMRDRNILRGESFRFAPSSGKNPFEISRETFDEIKKFGQLEIVKALTKFLSIGGLYAEEILLRAGIDKRSPCEALGRHELDKIFNQLQLILSSLKGGRFEPCIIIDEKGEWVDVTPIKLKKYEHFRTKGYTRFNEALDEFYMETLLELEKAEAARTYERQLARLRRVLKRQQEMLEDTKNVIQQNRRFGELIYAHLGELQLLRQRILHEKKSGKPWKLIVSKLQKEREKGNTPARYFETLDSKQHILTVTLEDIKLQLDITRSVQASAAKFYEKVKKAQKKLEGAQKALEETKTKIEQLQQKKRQVAKEVKPPPVKREKAWYEKFRWFFSSDNLLVIGGKDATTNEILIKKHMEPHDIVFHADIIGAPFVLLKTEGKTPSDHSIKEAAQFAASYSRAWKETFATIDVYWVHPEQVSKTPPSGHFLRKGSFMIRGAKNYLRNVPLTVAIGVQVNDYARIIGGPPEAISKHAKVYVEIVPGEEKSSRLAKKIRQLLAEKAPKDWRKRILEISIQEIQAFIPSGKGNIKISEKLHRMVLCFMSSLLFSVLL